MTHTPGSPEEQHRPWTHAGRRDVKFPVQGDSSPGHRQRGKRTLDP
jgi:hypothetical protein